MAGKPIFPSHSPPSQLTAEGRPPRNCKYHAEICSVPEWEVVEQSLSKPPLDGEEHGHLTSRHCGMCTTILNLLGGHPGSCWGAEGSQGIHPSPTPVQPSHCPGRVTLEEVSECKARGQEDLLQSNYLLKDSVSKYSHILRS